MNETVINASKEAVASNKKINVRLLVLGIIFVTISFICVGTSSSDPDTTTLTLLEMISIYFFFVGACFIFKYYKNYTLIDKFEQYVAAYNNGYGVYIPNLAVAVRKPESKVKKELSKMIKKKFIPNGYIDNKNNCILFGNLQYEPYMTENPLPNVNPNAKRENVAIKCNGCGGMNDIPHGKVAECSYCGSPIKAE